MKKVFLLIISFSLFAFTLPEKKKIKIFLAGDSTMSVKETKAYPETGWGMPFTYFWDSTVTLVNRAKNGRSTKTFISEGLWKSITDELKEGDYVFIQFGHNDEGKEKVAGESASTIDNVEHVYLKELPRGRYRIEVTRKDKLEEEWEYALAWRIEKAVKQ